MSPLTLAFLGDAVYELLVRQYLVAQGNRPSGQLHRLAVGKVCAGAQSAVYDLLEPLLTPEEDAILKRGRNAHPGHLPKHAQPADYRRATGVEALFGYLYLKGDLSRIEELFLRIQKEEEGE